MAAISKFEDIRAWQTARALNREIYRVSRRRPFADDWALCLQIRRASISVMSNIAEGFESRTQRQFIEYLAGQRLPAAECVLNFTPRWTLSISMRNNSMV